MSRRKVAAEKVGHPSGLALDQSRCVQPEMGQRKSVVDEEKDTKDHKEMLSPQHKDCKCPLQQFYLFPFLGD